MKQIAATMANAKEQEKQIKKTKAYVDPNLRPMVQIPRNLKENQLVDFIGQEAKDIVMEYFDRFPKKQVVEFENVKVRRAVGYYSEPMFTIHPK